MFSASKTSGPSGYNLTNSLRFRASASAFLNRTFGSTYTDKTKSTLSFWVKRGLLNVTNGQTIMWYNASGASGHITFAGAGAGGTLVNDCLNFSNRNATTGSGDYGFQTTQLFRDPAAWYHIMVVFDTGQATSSNRVKLYVNGSEVTAFVSAQYPPQNYQTTAFLGGNASAHIIGYGATTGATVYFDGYLDEYHFIDGQALTPSSFGSFNATTGVWQPARYTGTYGTNGFYLNFTDIGLTSGSNTGLGRDFSGNGNFWNTNNISVTAGETYDAMTDVPTNTSATVANYAVLNPVIYSPSTTYSRANLSFTASNTNWTQAVGTIVIPSTGKWYWEVVVGSSIGAGQMHGITATSSTLYSAGSTNWVGWNPLGYAYFNDGTKYNNNAGVAYGNSYTANDIIGIAFDADNGKLFFSKNGTWQASGDPVAGTNAAFTGLTGNSFYPAFSLSTNTGASTADINFGQRPFAYTPPTGFLRLNTFNLPTSTIVKGNTVMDATVYTGTGGFQSITNAGSMQPDLLWIKSRSNAVNNVLIDSVRGNNLYLVSNSTAAEVNNGGPYVLLNSNGFSVGADSQSGANGYTYVAWQWQAGQGSTSSNTSGSITSTVSVNTTAGFSVVTYSATGSTFTVGHGLGVAPSFVIHKQRDNGTNNWLVYHKSLGLNSYLSLNATNASATLSGIWTSSSTTFGSNYAGANPTLTGTHLFYCWAEIAGFSRFTSYTGNGSADGPFVYLGFRPKFVLVKSSTSAEAWYINDSARDTFNPDLRILAPNLSAAEFNNGSTWMDLTSNGFKIRYNTAPFNTNAATYIVAAWAENPFKNALAR